MPEIVQCPGCGKNLRILDELLGREVKCPACGDRFVANPLTAPPPDAMQQRPAARRIPDDDPEEERLAKRRGDDREDEDEDDRPRRRRAQDDEDDEDDRPRRRRAQDDKDEDDRPRRRGSRKKASAAATAPGIALLIVGILGLLMGGVYLIQAIFGRPFFAPANQPAPYPVVLLWLFAFITLIWGAVVTLGGMKLMRLESWGSVLTACIFAMLPCNPCCMLGLPLGIWGLVVLSRDDVKNAFH